MKQFYALEHHINANLLNTNLKEESVDKTPDKTPLKDKKVVNKVLNYKDSKNPVSYPNSTDKISRSLAKTTRNK